MFLTFGINLFINIYNPRLKSVEIIIHKKYNIICTTSDALENWAIQNLRSITTIG